VIFVINIFILLINFIDIKSISISIENINQFHKTKKKYQNYFLSKRRIIIYSIFVELGNSLDLALTSYLVLFLHQFHHSFQVDHLLNKSYNRFLNLTF
jgi:hypothetical protein